ncbi:hypothetical protein TNCV_3597701 [Trichonephila clavipes]|nr:hypothetical protein TNCV_3597701 [Trichonephila clavipes]
MRRYAGRRNGGVSGSIKHVVGVRSVFLAKGARRIAVKNTPSCCISEKWRIIQSVRRHLDALPEVESLGSWEEGRTVTSQKKQAADSGEIARHDIGDWTTDIAFYRGRLHGSGLFTGRPVRCVPLTPAHRRRRSL